MGREGVLPPTKATPKQIAKALLRDVKPRTSNKTKNRETKNKNRRKSHILLSGK